jgi:secreted PhoX family phosphatase
MFPGYLTANPEYTGAPDSDDAPPEPEFLTNPTKEIVDTELAAHGLSIVEVRRNATGGWDVVRDSAYNRRITATTPMEVAGPAAGHEPDEDQRGPGRRPGRGHPEQLRRRQDPVGHRHLGRGELPAVLRRTWPQLGADAPQLREPRALRHQRGRSAERRWEEFYDRFDVAKEPNEPFRFGWGIEFDPYDPNSVPKKRTTMGRNKHEGHTSVRRPRRPGCRSTPATTSASSTPTSSSPPAATTRTTAPPTWTCSTRARSTLPGSTTTAAGEWLPLVHGEGQLTEANGFASQADVVIDARFAGDAVGATKMDRPEDFEANPVTGKVYLVLTNNNQREIDQVDEANPRINNLHGHIIEITEENDDHAGTTFTWEMFLLAGDPAQGSTYFGGFSRDEVSPISSPDNITFDVDGNLWISTDGLPNNLPGNDGLFVAPTEGEARGHVQQFFSSVPGGEVSGPVFNPDNSALFVSIQHPGEGGTYEEPMTRWPDGGSAPPRPSVVLIQAGDGTARVGNGRG